MQRPSRFCESSAQARQPFARRRHIRPCINHNLKPRLPFDPMKASRRLAVVMDPIADIKHAKDSTLAMLIAAQARGFELFYLEQRDLALRDGTACARLRPLTVRDDPLSWATLG